MRNIPHRIKILNRKNLSHSFYNPKLCLFRVLKKYQNPKHRSLVTSPKNRREKKRRVVIIIFNRVVVVVETTFVGRRSSRKKGAPVRFETPSPFPKEKSLRRSSLFFFERSETFSNPEGGGGGGRDEMASRRTTTLSLVARTTMMTTMQTATKNGWWWWLPKSTWRNNTVRTVRVERAEMVERRLLWTHKKSGCKTTPDRCAVTTTTTPGKRRWWSSQKGHFGMIAVTRSYARGASGGEKLVAAPMVYVAGEEMTKYVMDLVKEKWIAPNVDTSKWEHFDMSAKNRDDTNDRVLKDVVSAGFKLKAIFKEPTITPTADQVKRLGLRKTWGSPNGAMRRGWNGITISRDTIHIDGIELGYKGQVLFERHAVGGEYAAGWKNVGRGTLKTTFVPKDGPDAGKEIVVDERECKDAVSAVVTYDNAYDNVHNLAKFFFERCLDAGVKPYVVTKKTVFKWQEPFWQIMKDVYDRDFKAKFIDKKVVSEKDAELIHLLSDAATMKLVQWTQGNFGMAAHNYDGDVLTDELAQMHKSPGFITSNLVGVAPDGSYIKEFEASHGTVTDMNEARLRGEETSLNPLGMVEGLIGAMNHASFTHDTKENHQKMVDFTTSIREIMHKLFREGKGTRDLSGPSGATTEEFIDRVADELKN